MTYKKRLNEMTDLEIECCIAQLFRAQNTRQKRTREQNLALLTSWLDAMGLKSKHEFVFYQEDGTNELWLMNRDQTNCLCCKQTTQQTGLKQPDKTRNVHRSASPRIEKNDSQVTVITIQPGAARHIHSAATSRQVSPNLPRRQIPQRPAKKEEQSFWQQCCGECSSICSNLFS